MKRKQKHGFKLHFSMQYFVMVRQGALENWKVKVINTYLFFIFVQKIGPKNHTTELSSCQKTFFPSYFFFTGPSGRPKFCSGTFEYHFVIWREKINRNVCTILRNFALFFSLNWGKMLLLKYKNPLYFQHLTHQIQQPIPKLLIWIFWSTRTSFTVLVWYFVMYFFINNNLIG